jgi:adenosylcobinamide-phosphate synthase
MGDMIKWFEKNFYKDSKVRGAILTLSVVGSVFLVTFFIESFITNTIVLAILASTTISSKMLYDEVKKVLKEPQNIKYLVSRDTKELSQSDIYKASIETYAENLSDGVVAPLFYLLLFGLKGAFVYKAINTLDSMVGYKTKRYKNFGYFSAKLDDLANFFPSKITAIMIGGDIKKIFSCARFHESPNAGYPICAMAYKVGVKLGGDTKYFGKVKKKPDFGEGRERIEKNDVLKALETQRRVDGVIFVAIIIFKSLKT